MGTTLVEDLDHLILMLKHAHTRDSYGHDSERTARSEAVLRYAKKIRVKVAGPVVNCG